MSPEHKHPQIGEEYINIHSNDIVTIIETEIAEERHVKIKVFKLSDGSRWDMKSFLYHHKKGENNYEI